LMACALTNVEQVYVLVPPIGLLALKFVVRFITDLDRLDLTGELLREPRRELGIGSGIVLVSVKLVAIGDAGTDFQPIPSRKVYPVL
jgi:hypothetical protein